MIWYFPNASECFRYEALYKIIETRFRRFTVISEYGTQLGSRKQTGHYVKKVSQKMKSWWWLIYLQFIQKTRVQTIFFQGESQ